MYVWFDLRVIGLRRIAAGMVRWLGMHLSIWVCGYAVIDCETGSMGARVAARIGRG